MIATLLDDNPVLDEVRVEQIRRLDELLPLVLARYKIYSPSGETAATGSCELYCRTQREFTGAPVGPRSMNSYTWEDTPCG